jgi:hypothetical protein
MSNEHLRLHQRSTWRERRDHTRIHGLIAVGVGSRSKQHHETGQHLFVGSDFNFN